MTIDLSSNTGSDGSSSDPESRHTDDMPEEVRNKVAAHPCYSEQAHHLFARMHLAVAPACNLQCHYCNHRHDCANESRPGVASRLLTPEQAVAKVLAVARAIPNLSVVGIAGPGDPLANPRRTFATLRGVAEHAPQLKLCLSTNGLSLPEHVDEIVRHRVDHVTITINSIDPAVADGIYAWVRWGRQRLRGLAAARVLLEQQQRGLEMLVERGVLVKVNSVMIPGVNDMHIREVSRFVKAKGAFLHNIMPLISDPRHGTHYGVTGQREPTTDELAVLQDKCGGQMSVMRHCKRCRADAVGMLGEDRCNEFAIERTGEREPGTVGTTIRPVAIRPLAIAGDATLRVQEQAGG